MNQPPRASNQVSLWQPGAWQLGILGGPQSPDYVPCMNAVYVVDCAIRRMMEQKK